MSRGFTGTTQKQRRSPHNGNIIPEAKEITAVRSNVKVLLTVFLDSRGVVHHEYAPQGQTVNKQYYEGVLCRLRNAEQRKRPDLWAAETWQLHHDNAPAHSSHLIQGFLAKHNIPLVRQAPYSPDMAPCDFWLFPKLKMPLKGTRFEPREDIMRNAKAQLYKIPQEAFQTCFQQWRTAGRSVCITKEITLKGIRVSDVKINNCIFADQRSDTFCTAHVYLGQLAIGRRGEI